ncbi:ATP synthase gamma chain [Planctomycetales bacterium]|nr:ATP synthase gamma chain [Planctomycetales bacterium]GHT05423.1 ATP synthase gamma chain [Planctomycetales bacterium]GHV19660.1 ATP synthase gamma chain [Planctomycetales bacterium]
MAQGREISSRISSVKSTQKITRAMKMVAAARLNRAQARMDGIRNYGRRIAQTLVNIGFTLFGDEHPLLKPRPSAKRRLYIVIAGDRGLCGGFNSNVARFLDQNLTREEVASAKFFAIGRRGIANVKKKFGDAGIVKSWVDVFDKLSFQLTNDIAKNLLAAYQAANPKDRIDEAFVVYNRFASRIKQEVVKEQIMPLSADKLREQLASVADAEKNHAGKSHSHLAYELSEPQVIVTEMVEHWVSVNLFHAITESYAAELAARVSAMESATDAAQEMIDGLTLSYNRARQTAITNELIDIVGGANTM